MNLSKRACLHNTIILTPRLCSERVSSNDMTVDKAFPAVSWDITLHLMRTKLDSDTRRMLFLVNGHAQLEPLQKFISCTLPSISIAAPDGYADIVAFKEEWSQAWESSRLLLVTGPTVMHLLFHGLLSLRDISLLIFDDVTGAIKQHPYCLVMRYFYTPIRVKQIMADEGVSCQPILEPPLVLGFAMSQEEDGMTNNDIFAKRQCYQRNRTLQRDFHAVLLPSPNDNHIRAIDNRVIIKSIPNENHIIVQKGYSLVLVDDKLYPEVLEKECQVGTDVVSCWNDAFLDETDSEFENVLITPCTDPIRLCYATEWALMRTNGKVTVLIRPNIDTKAAAILLHLITTSTLITKIPRNSTSEDLEQTNADALTLTHLRSDFACIYGELEELAKCSVLKDEGPLHVRTETGALLLPEISADMLLRLCSAIPKEIPCARLKVRTYPIKKFEGEDRRSDSPVDPRTYFLTRIRLPTILHALYPSLPQVIDGPVTLSRSDSQKRAAHIACRALLTVGVLDSNLVISSELMARLAEWDNTTPLPDFSDEQLFLEPSTNDLLDRIGSSFPSAIEFQLNQAWRSFLFDKDKSDKVLYVYRLSAQLITRAQVVDEYAEAGSKGTHNKDTISTDPHSPLWLTPESRILVSSFDHFSPEFLSWALALPLKLPTDLVPCLPFPIGTDHYIKTRLASSI